MVSHSRRCRPWAWSEARRPPACRLPTLRSKSGTVDFDCAILRATAVCSRDGSSLTTSPRGEFPSCLGPAVEASGVGWAETADDAATAGGSAAGADVSAGLWLDVA